MDGLIGKTNEAKIAAVIDQERSQVNRAAQAALLHWPYTYIEENNFKTELNKTIGEGKYTLSYDSANKIYTVTYVESNRSYTINNWDTDEETENAKATLVINTKIAKFAKNTVSAQLSFSVKAQLNGKEVYNNILNVTHEESAGEKAIIIKDIPTGANVTINAVYNTLSYKLTSNQTATVTLEGNKATIANFEYTYDYKNITGSSATTALLYDGSSLSHR